GKVSVAILKHPPAVHGWAPATMMKLLHLGLAADEQAAQVHKAAASVAAAHAAANGDLKIRNAKTGQRHTEEMLNKDQRRGTKIPTDV
ncbi:MAG TPA: hypothetical protein VI731_06990, partial [Bacteroidia bacterium]|nr:hypothetical protein [Bacteroidia bacterium]